MAGPDDTPILARLVTNWATTDAEIDTFIAVLRG
jgi:threonine aldolase